jgi:hypothetical protein
VCGEIKPPSDYAKNGSGIASRCKPCHRAYTRRHYESNKARYVEKATVRNRTQQRKLREIVLEAKSGQGCADCGEVYHSRRMHFDHLPGSVKVGNIANLVRRVVSEEVLRAEIDKCEIVCEWCHARRSWDRRSSGVGNPG